MYINLVRVFINYYNVHLLSGFIGIRSWVFSLRIVDGRSVVLESRLSPNGGRDIVDNYKVYDIPLDVDMDEYRDTWEMADLVCSLLQDVFKNIVRSYKLEYE